jgi:hypothetical protein
MANGKVPPPAIRHADGLGEVERGESRIHRQREYDVGERDFIVLKPIAFTPEQDGDVLSGGDPRRHEACGLSRSDDWFGLIVGARGGSNSETAIADCFGNACVERRAIEQVAGAGRHHPRLVIGPALSRPDETKLRKAEISHGPRCGADILAKLGFDQHDDRARLRDPRLRFVSARSGHGPLVFPGAAQRRLRNP